MSGQYQIQDVVKQTSDEKTNNNEQVDMVHRAIGRGVRWVHPLPLTCCKGPLNLRGRVKMTPRIQEKWTLTVEFQNFPRKYTLGSPLDAHALALAPTL